MRKIISIIALMFVLSVAFASKFPTKFRARDFETNEVEYQEIPTTVWLAEQVAKATCELIYGDEECKIYQFKDLDGVIFEFKFWGYLDYNTWIEYVLNYDEH